MPQVPSYAPQVQERALPNTRVLTDVPDGALGGGKAQEAFTKTSLAAADTVTSAGVEIYKEEKKKADDAMLTDLDLEASHEQTRIENEVQKMRGKSSGGSLQYAQEEWKKVSENVKKRASTDEQRAQIDQRLKVRYGNIDKVAQNHTSAEFRRYDNEQSQAYLDASEEEAVNNYRDPRRIGQSLYVQEQEVRKIGQRNGDSNEVTQQKILKVRSKTHTAIIDRMLAQGDDQLAKNYFTSNRSALSEDDETKVARALEDGSLRGESQRVSDRVLAEGYTDLADARERAKKLTSHDPKLRDAVDERVIREYGYKEKQYSVMKSQNYLEAYNVLEKTKKARGVVHIEDIPQNIWGAMTPDQRDSASALVKRLNQPEAVVQNDRVFLQYYGMPEQKLANVSEGELVEKVHPYVNEASWSKISTKWQKVRDAKNNPKKADEVKSMYTDEEMVLTSLRANKVDGIVEADTMAEIYKNEKKAAAYNQFRKRVDDAWQAHAYNNGGKMPTAKEKQQIIDKMIYDKVWVRKYRAGIDSLASDVEKPVAALTDEETGNSYVPYGKIDLSTRDEMSNLIVSLGKKVTRDKLERMRAARLRDDRVAYKKIAEE